MRAPRAAVGLLVALLAACGSLGVPQGPEDDQGAPEGPVAASAPLTPAGPHAHAQHNLSPGVADPQASPATLCHGLPPRTVSDKEKATVRARYSIAESERGRYVIDHLVPRGVGGLDVLDNLWPQLIAEAKAKDVIEVRWHDDICAGKTTVAEAQAFFIREWG